MIPGMFINSINVEMRGFIDKSRCIVYIVHCYNYLIIWLCILKTHCKILETIESDLTWAGPYIMWFITHAYKSTWTHNYAWTEYIISAYYM